MDKLRVAECGAGATLAVVEGLHPTYPPKSAQSDFPGLTRQKDRV